MTYYIFRQAACSARICPGKKALTTASDSFVKIVGTMAIKADCSINLLPPFWTFFPAVGSKLMNRIFFCTF